MKQPKLGPIFLAIFIAFLFILLSNVWQPTFISKKTVEEQANSLETVVFQGEALQRQMLKDKNFLPIYGSSELSRFSSFHPSFYFKSQGINVTPFLVGRGGTQTLIHFLNLSGLYDNLKDKKLVYVISPTWFRPNGITDDRFTANYSKLDAYLFAMNQKINKNIKKEAAERLLRFGSVKNDPILSRLLESEINPNSISSTEKKLLTDAANSYLNVANKTDYLASSLSRPPFRKYKLLPKGLSYSELMAIANKESAPQSKGNPFWMRESIFKSNVQPEMSQPHMNMRDPFGSNSTEYTDLQLLIDLLKDAKAKPLFISMPVNGYVYDYAGYKKDERQQYYERVKSKIEAAGFPVADLSKYEYEKYFFQDSLHPSYKGWIHVDKAIMDFLKK